MSDYSDLLARICDLETKLGELEFRLKALEDKEASSVSSEVVIYGDVLYCPSCEGYHRYRGTPCPLVKP